MKHRAKAVLECDMKGVEIKLLENSFFRVQLHCLRKGDKLLRELIMLGLFIKAKCVRTKNFKLLFVKHLSLSLSIWLMEWLIKRPQAFLSGFSNIKEN